ncbi:hypothetical protein ABGB17_38290 [Sphaerisporangium sp. B11E5]
MATDAAETGTRPDEALTDGFTLAVDSLAANGIETYTGCSAR